MLVSILYYDHNDVYKSSTPSQFVNGLLVYSYFSISQIELLTSKLWKQLVTRLRNHVCWSLSWWTELRIKLLFILREPLFSFCSFSSQSHEFDTISIWHNIDFKNHANKLNTKRSLKYKLLSNFRDQGPLMFRIKLIMIMRAKKILHFALICLFVS